MNSSSRPVFRRFTRFPLALAAILATGAAAGITLGPSSPAGAATRGPSAPLATSFSIAGGLAGVAATSARNAWAVGSTGSFASPRLLIARWNGTSWKQATASGLPAGELTAVTATSASNAWAVGTTNSRQSLILRWNGTSWKRAASAGAAGTISGVAASSASNAWAVGTTGSLASPKPLLLHWNGTSWKQVPSPGIAGTAFLDAVAVTSGSNAWAVGEVSAGAFTATSLILHWNGTSWKRVASPTASDGKFGNVLAGVVATSATSAWAVGCTDGCPVGGTPLIERWNGASWKQVAAPATPFGLYDLRAVAATSASNIWAVGGGGPVTGEGTATTHWNGHSWTLGRARSGAELAGVAVTSATSAWAVGETAAGRTLILHWNGTTWS
jgi:hypothetical protein